MTGVLLEVKGLTKIYSNNRAIEDIDQVLNPGNVHALIGENGAGKSTLIKILTGLVSQSRGKVLWDGSEIVFRKPQDAIRMGIVAVHQELTLVETMTVSENIWLGHEPLTRWGTIDFPKMKKQAVQLLVELGIKIDAGRPVKQLTLAEKQLVEFCKAMSYKPRLLVLDEATSTIGEKEVENLQRIVKRLKEQGVSILFVSHRMKEIYQFCDTCTILKDGQKVREAKLSEITEQEIIECMTGYEVDCAFPPKNLTKNDKGSALLEVKGLCTGSGLKDVNLTLDAGEIIGIGGLQGHGQIDLIHALFGMEKVNNGTFKINGVKKRIRNPIQAIYHGFQLVPQDRKTEGLFLELTVAENIIQCSLDKISKFGLILKNKQDKSVKDIVDKLKIKVSSPRQTVKYLSGGNQQKIALGKWLLRQGKILMLIEPTRGIDVNTKMEIYSLLRQIAANGYGVIIYTNELLELIGLCDRVTVMFEKGVVRELSGDDITEQNIVAASFGKNLGGGGCDGQIKRA